ncbi:MAG TPA: nuclear transport factor 2 family protein [Chitinophagaceae bacterium]|nr:nuclear transport factor 2 family protein [Chitinophagaceae bacterium]
MIDPNTLPKPLSDFITAQNEFNTEAFVKTFTDNATVQDEGGEYHRSAEIKEWFETTKGKYDTHMDPIAYEEKSNECIVTIMMSGTFPGSPLPAKFHFVLKKGKIASLRIA